MKRAGLFVGTVFCAGFFVAVGEEPDLSGTKVGVDGFLGLLGKASAYHKSFSLAEPLKEQGEIEKASKTYEEIQATAQKAGTSLAGPFLPCLAYLDFLRGRYREAHRTTLLWKQTRSSTSLDLLSLKRLIHMRVAVEHDPNDLGFARVDAEVEMGYQLPLSHWASARNSLVSPIEERMGMRVDILIPLIPGASSDHLSLCGKLYEQMGYLEFALVANLEAVYAKGDWDTNDQKMPMADVWRRTAALSMRLGDAPGAFDAYLKALIRDPKIGEDKQCRADLERILSGAPIEPEVTRAQPDPETFHKIARLYAHMNAHPRGIKAIERLERDTEKQYPEWKQELSDQWKEVLWKYTMDKRGPVYLYGQLVTENGGPTKANTKENIRWVDVPDSVFVKELQERLGSRR